MKKIIIYLLCFIILCFFLPIVFTDKKTEKVSKEITQDNNIISLQDGYDYREYNTIRLLHTSTGQIEELNLDEYLYGVVSAEMPASFEEEALKAQAIVARTYTIYKIKNDKSKHQNADICDDSKCCQAWISKEDRFLKWNEEDRQTNWNKIVASVNDTKGKIITYENEPINAFFHSNSGGITETTADVWGGEGYPYLQSVETSGEEGYSQYNSEVILTKQEFIEKMKEKYQDFEIEFNNENSIKILEYTNANRVKKIKIGNKELSGVEVRNILGLKSANFNIVIEGENIKFEVIGYGHGVGMSQTGANSMAKEGKNHEEIIKHFYSGVEIKDI